MKSPSAGPLWFSVALHAIVCGGLALWSYPLAQPAPPPLPELTAAAGGEGGEPEELVIRMKVSPPLQQPQPRRQPVEPPPPRRSRIVSTQATVFLPPPTPAIPPEPLSTPVIAQQEAPNPAEQIEVSKALAFASTKNGAGTGRASAGKSASGRGSGRGFGSAKGDGAGDSGVAYKRKAPLVYPRSARASRDSGVVQVRVLVSTSGRATEIKITRSSGNSELDEAAVRCARQSEYIPATRKGSAISAWVDASFRFRIDA